MKKETLKEYTPPENRVKVKEITIEVAEKMLEAAEKWASQASVPCSIAVVDKSGAVVAVHKMDGSPSMTADIAINKAFTAAYAGVSTYLLSKDVDPRLIGEIAGSYYIGLLTQLKGRLNLIPGGEPVRDEKGTVIGAIGISGVPEGVGDISDTTACQAGISALYD